MTPDEREDWIIFRLDYMDQLMIDDPETEASLVDELLRLDEARRAREKKRKERDRGNA